MLPPILDGVVAHEKPLRTWQQVGTFESLRACNTERSQQNAAAFARLQTYQARRLASIDDHKGYAAAAAAWAQRDRSLCIGSDDPRLR